jgi:hypothetical protein
MIQSCPYKLDPTSMGTPPNEALPIYTKLPTIYTKPSILDREPRSDTNRDPIQGFLRKYIQLFCKTPPVSGAAPNGDGLKQREAAHGDDPPRRNRGEEVLTTYYRNGDLEGSVVECGYCRVFIQ